MTAALIRAQVERHSDAPKYVSTKQFAERAGAEPKQISLWLRTGTVWVPRPAVLLGRVNQPGWEPDALMNWRPGLPGVDRPEPDHFMATPEFAEEWHIPPELVWSEIREGRIREPDMWLGGRPGWRPR